MEWTGFTDAQLKHLRTADQDSIASSHQARIQIDSHIQQNRPQNTRPPPQRGRGRGAPGQNHSHVTDQAPLNQKQMLSKPKQVQQQERTNQKAERTKTPVSSGGPSSRDELSRMKTPVHKQSVTHQTPNVSSVENRIQSANSLEGSERKDEKAEDKTIKDAVDKSEALLGKELDEKEGLSRELSKMEQFQQQQKEIEDENLRKRNLLAMALADRKKKTQAEAKRLVYIQKELSKIEEFLTNDVNILRDKIEEASRHYMEAQKRYQKAESEFVSAKILLHKASDHKEGLTGHLCTIIRENELRKSKKLEELVEKLDMDNLDVFEAELEAAEAAKKAETQSHSSSSSVGGTLEEPKRTSSTGDASPVEKTPREPNVPSDMTSGEEVKDSSCDSQGQRLTSPSGIDATQKEVPLPNSNSHASSETQDKNTSERIQLSGGVDSNKNLSKQSEQSQELRVTVGDCRENIPTESLASGST